MDLTWSDEHGETHHELSDEAKPLVALGLLVASGDEYHVYPDMAWLPSEVRLLTDSVVT